MPADLNYRSKYLDLRTKYMNDLDTAFRLGFEQGAQQAEQKQALDAQAQSQEMEQQAMAQAGGMGEQPPGQGMPSGQPPAGSPSELPGQKNPMESSQASAQGSELDQHIGKLEGMLNSPDSKPEEIKKSFEDLVSFRKAEKFATEMKKSDEAVKGIVKALHKPSFKMGTQAQHNMTDNAKSALSLQHKIVNDVMSQWKSEEDKASNSILNILDIENLTKE